MRRALYALALVVPAALLARPAHHHAAAPADDAGVAADDEVEHVVKAGETIGGVATRAHVPRVLIEEANHLKPPYHLHAGQRLFLPRTRHHTVRQSESSFDISMRYGVAWKAIATANGMAPDAPPRPGQKLLIPTLIPPGGGAVGGGGDDAAVKADDGASVSHGFRWPLAGKVVRGFTPRDNADHHDGIDIAAPAGAAVRAAADGEVIFAGNEPQSFGRLVVIDHGSLSGGGWQTAYGFLSKLTVVKGDHVKAHERIGLVGHSGKAKGDELHFEIRHDNKPVDPMHHLPGGGPHGEKPAVKGRHHKAKS